MSRWSNNLQDSDDAPLCIYLLNKVLKHDRNQTTASPQQGICRSIYGNGHYVFGVDFQPTPTLTLGSVLALLCRAPAWQVHVYATDPSSPTMDTSDSVGWFTVDMRDLAGQRRQERWVKLQGASPAEVLISSSLSLAVERDPQQGDRYSTKEPHHLEQQRRPASSGSITLRGAHRSNAPASPHAAQGRGVGPTPAISARLGQEAVINVDANSSIGSGSVSSHTRSHSHSYSHSTHSHSMHSRSRSRSSGNPEDAAAAADAVSDLDALPVGPGADSEDAATFSLAISVKRAAGLSALSTASTDSIDGGGGAGFWLSYSIFGVVVQTDRFDRLAPNRLGDGDGDGDGPVLEPMLDSFRLRATLQGLCQFFGEAPPLQVSQPADDM